MSNRRIQAGVVLIGIICAMAVLAPLLPRYDPQRFDPNLQIDIVALKNAPPSADHPLGTDSYGRDVLSRVLHGARVSLAIGLVSVLVSLTVGTTIGLISGLSGGIADACLMRTVDAALSIPRLFLLLVVVALWQTTGVVALILVLGFTSWFETSRLVRAEVLSVKRREFIVASRALGIPAGRLIVRHVLPNVTGPILVAGTLAVGNIILIESGLSYLGFGVGPPTATLGDMMREGKDFLRQAPWTVIAPALFVIMTVLAFSVLSEGLRESADPRGATR